MWDVTPLVGGFQPGLDFLLHIQLVHNVVPGSLVRQVINDLPGGVFDVWYLLVLLNRFMRSQPYRPARVGRNSAAYCAE